MARVAPDSKEIQENRDWDALTSMGEPLPLEMLPDYYAQAAT